MQLTDSSVDKALNPSIDRLLIILSVTTFILLSPYFVWGQQLLVFRISHLLGNLIILYIIIKHHNCNIFSIELAIFFLLVSLYIMIGGTENQKFSYIPILSLLFISLKPDEQLGVFNHFVSILTVVYSIGLISYLLNTLGLNFRIGQAIAPNEAKGLYSVYFGHIEESGLRIYRFCSVFDEAGVVGTLNGLILSVIGISLRNIKSIILLLAGFVSFSLAFYIILFFILLFNLNIKKISIVIFILIILIFVPGNVFKELIASRLTIENGRFVGDNRTHVQFESYYDFFLEKGGKDLVFGKGVGSTKVMAEAIYVSSYKTLLINYGIVGCGLIISFYILSTLYNSNTKKGWFLFLIFIISAYQRPDLINFYTLVLFLGGLQYSKLNSVTA